MKISQGDKTAKATGIRFITSKAGTLGLEVSFAFREVGPDETVDAKLTWVGWLTDKSTENTMRTLVEVLEYNGDDQVVSVPNDDARSGMLANQDAINRKKEVTLVVEIENYTNNEGKTLSSPKIKWVNNLGGGQFSGASVETVAQGLGASGFKAAFLAAKKGVPDNASKANKEEDIPF